MIVSRARNWGLWLLRGLAAVVFGILAFVWPGITVAVLVLFFGAYVLVDGFLAVIAAIAHRHDEHNWWLWLLEGLAGIVIGILTFVYPGVTALALLYLIVAWALVTGVLEIVAAVRLRRVIRNEWWMVLAGLASIAFGILALLFPAAGVLSIVWLIAAYAVVFGVALIAFAFRLRSWNRTVPPDLGPHPEWGERG